MFEDKDIDQATNRIIGSFRQAKGQKKISAALAMTLLALIDAVSPEPSRAKQLLSLVKTIERN